VRPLYDDKSRNNSTVTRDEVFELVNPAGAPPILSIFGGKITTYRKLAEHALHKLPMPWIEADTAWTDGATLPGGDMPADGFDRFAQQMQDKFDWCPSDTMLRLCRAYGSLVSSVIGDADSWTAMGQDFGAGLTEREVEYSIEHEFVRTADDILWRRSKLGLHMSEVERSALHDWFAKRDASA
jgi:glycerol-3-phosphate dehydrogenase